MKSYLSLTTALFFGLVGFAMPALVHAVAISTLDGNGADIHVSEQSSGGDGTSGQTDKRLFFRTRHDSSFRHEVTYLRFDLSSVGGTIDDAVLEMYQLAGGNIDFDMYGLNDDPSEIGGGAWDWEEATATYNSVPGISMSDGDGLTSEIIPAEVTDLGEYSNTTTDLVTKSFSSAAITAFLNADTNGVVTFIFESQSTGASIFRSSRTAFDPGEHPPRLYLGEQGLTVDRDTGNLSIINASPIDLANVIGYSITSASDALAPAAWIPISGNYDASSPGLNQVDPDNNWTILTDSASRGDLSETEFEGNGAPNNGADFLNGSTTDLGNAWIQYYKEDVTMELLYDNGDILPIDVSFTGNGDSPFQFGDLDFDGDVDEDDFYNEFLPNFESDTSALISGAERYRLGDMDEDGTVSFEDFFRLNNAYMAANPGGAALSFSPVPEPTTLLLLTMATAGLVLRRRRVA